MKAAYFHPKFWPTWLGLGFLRIFEPLPQGVLYWLGRGVGLLIYGGTIVMNIDNFIRPRLVSGRSQVHPVLILIGVLGGLKIFGFIGMLAGPLVLALLVAFTKFYEQAYLQRKVSPSPAD